MNNLINSKNKLFLIFLLISLLFLGISQVSCSSGSEKVILATTTTVEDSGLLGLLIKKFNKKTGIEVQTIVAGSSEILRTAQMGNVDVVLTHAPKKELVFMKKGYGKAREPIMRNYFVLVGPKNDKADVKQAKSIDKAFTNIYENQAQFVSRDDDSGTNIKEGEIWAMAGKKPKGTWYKKSGQGMGETLFMANDLNAYTLSDSATYLKLSSNLKSIILYSQKEKFLENLYSVILVTAKRPNKNALELYNWLSGNDAAKVIRQYKSSKGQPLFEVL